MIAYERGRSAARMGLSIAVCPFTITNKRHPGMQQVYVTYWHRGWDDGKAENRHCSMCDMDWNTEITSCPLRHCPHRIVRSPEVTHHR